MRVSLHDVANTRGAPSALLPQRACCPHLALAQRSSHGTHRAPAAKPIWLPTVAHAPCSTGNITLPPHPSRHGCTGASCSRLERGRLAPGTWQRRQRASGAPPAPALRQKRDAAVRACVPAPSAGSAEPERWRTAHASPAAEKACSAAGHCSSGVSSMPATVPADAAA